MPDKSSVEQRRKAVRSLCEEDPDLEPEIDSFVIRLAEQVDHLQDAEQVGAFDALSERAASIGEQADRLGCDGARGPVNAKARSAGWMR